MYAASVPSDYTRNDHNISTLEKKTIGEVLTSMHNIRVFSEFGNKSSSLAERHGLHDSIIYVQIIDPERMISTHGMALLEKNVDNTRPF